jgi:hypothetical protein
MKAERCQATAASGRPCSATPRPDRPFCLWHDPEAAELRRELSRRGGQARSNQARAKRHLPKGVLTHDELRGVLGLTIADVRAGTVEANVANAVASLARAYVAVSEAAAVETLEREVAELRDLIATRGLA